MSFTSELAFEESLINLLVTQKGWRGGVIKNPTEQDLMANWAKILFRMNNEKDRLNNVPLNEAELNQLIRQINNLKSPLLKNAFINGTSVSIKRENPDDTLHFGKEVSLKLFDRKEIAGGDSNYQIAQQPQFVGKDKIKGDNRGDFIFLINGLPVIHVELKRSGVPVSKAVNQIQRYIHNGVFSTGIYSLVQLFIAMTPEEMRYFANPGTDPNVQINNNYIFEWADFNNDPIKDWRKNASSFLSIPMAHQLIGYYTVADTADDTLKVLRSYQIYAVKEIFDRIEQITWHEQHQLGGYIWHTTGSGKTLTSFKAAELVASYGVADKVVFLMDRIELGTQSLSEFRGFAEYEEDVQGTDNTFDLLRKLKSKNSSETLIVTSIQKMSNINEEEVGQADLDNIREKRVVFIVDEAHRSTFGEMLSVIKKTLPDAIFFGFTGTPIQEENKRKDSTTATIFGNELHRYSIYDGIRDENVLGFDVTAVATIDYEELRQSYALKKANAKTPEEAFSDPDKAEVYNYYMDSRKVGMLGHYDEATGNYVEGIETNGLTNQAFDTDEHRQEIHNDIMKQWVNLSKNGKYSAILATHSIAEAIKHYRLLKNNSRGLKVTALFDKNIDESEGAIFKEDGLAEILKDYNELYDKAFTIPHHAHFKKDLSLRLARKGVYRKLAPEEQIDIVIVVDQLLTGYDSKWLNTLYLDKTMNYSNIIQAFSRTNRLNGPDKPFGTIRYYRKIYEMEESIREAVRIYSGNREFGLFVDKLGDNLVAMNELTEDITSVFSVDGIENFEELPKSIEARAKFAELFSSFNNHLEAALIQGFDWTEDTYLTIVDNGEEKVEVKIIFTEEMYQSWLLRYQELADASEGESSPDEVPLDIDYTLVQKDTGRIDYDYLNANFDRYVRSIEGGDPEERRRVKNDLHRFFATLTSDEQRYANMVINDLENGELVVEPGRDFMDYIIAYQERTESDNINTLQEAFDLDEKHLRNMMNLNITQNNLNEYGRFSKLKESVDRKKARFYLEETLGEKLKPFEVSRKVDIILRDFLLEDGFNVETYLKKEE